MIGKEPTWFVRLQGHTLGPLRTDELRVSVREGEISPEDKLNRSGETTWRRLRDFPDLLALWESLQRPAILLDIPHPALVWKKTRVSPMAPNPEPALASPEAPEPSAKLTPTPAELPKPASSSIPEKASPPLITKSRAKKLPKKTPSARGRKKKSPAEVPPLTSQELTAPIREIAPDSAEPDPVPAAASIPVANETAGNDTLIIAPEPPSHHIATELLPMEVQQGKARANAAFSLDTSAFPARPEASPALDLSPEAIRQLLEEERLRNQSRLGVSRVPARMTLALMVIALAALALWALQKTRDLKELPLPDPSSPTTQLPAASDPIQPLRAPTRPQRD